MSIFPELISAYREAFTAPEVFIASSFIPLAALIAIVLWVIWPQKRNKS